MAEDATMPPTTEPNSLLSLIRQAGKLAAEKQGKKVQLATAAAIQAKGPARGSVKRAGEREGGRDGEREGEGEGKS